MGSSSKKGTKTKQPKRIIISGEHCTPDAADSSGGDNGGGGASVGGGATSLLIPLVRIDSAVHGRVSVGDPVAIRYSPERIFVLVGNDRLGDVAPELDAEVRHRQVRSGVLESKECGPDRARVLAR